MYFFDPKAGDISDFEAVSNGLGKITFCDSNGVVVINANGKTVSFEISKQGDGVIRLNLPFETCRQALLESFEARKLLGDNYD